MVQGEPAASGELDKPTIPDWVWTSHQARMDPLSASIIPCRNTPRPSVSRYFDQPRHTGTAFNGIAQEIRRAPLIVEWSAEVRRALTCAGLTAWSAVYASRSSASVTTNSESLGFSVPITPYYRESG